MWRKIVNCDVKRTIIVCNIQNTTVLAIKDTHHQDNNDHISCYSLCTKNRRVAGRVKNFLNLRSGFNSNKLHFELAHYKQDNSYENHFFRHDDASPNKSINQPMYEMRTLLDFQVLFMATKQKLWAKLRATATSSMSGVVSLPGYPLSPVSRGINASYTISRPDGHSIMLSLSRSMFDLSGDIFKPTQLYRDGSVLHWRLRGRHSNLIYMFNTSIEVSFIAAYYSVGFQLQFSFHAYSVLPHRLRGNVFNCTVPHYASFKQHLQCNLEHECHAGEDEGGHCPFSNEACHGHVKVADKKCFALYTFRKPISWLDNQALCQEKGGQMAVFVLEEEASALIELFRIRQRVVPLQVGLMSGALAPNIYRRTLMWIDNTVAYTTPDITGWMRKFKGGFHAHYAIHGLYLEEVYLSSTRTGHYICEHTQHKKSSVNSKPTSTMKDAIRFSYTHSTSNEELLKEGLPPLVVCPAGHRTHDFLKCDREADCRETQYGYLQCPLSSGPRTQYTRKPG